MQRTFWALALAAALAFAARAETPDAGVGPAADAGTPEDEQLKKELEQSLQKDASAAAQQSGNAAPPPATAAPPPAGAQGTQARASQSLNPDISAILEA